MIRPGQLLCVVILLFLFVVLPGCGGDKPPADEGGAEATGAENPLTEKSAESTKPGEPGHEGHDHETPNSVGDGETASGAPDPFHLKPIAMATIPDRKSLAGRWILQQMQLIQPQKEGDQPQLGERPMMLISVSPGAGDEPDSVQFLAGIEQPYIDVSLVETKVSGSDLTFVGNSRAGEEVFDFKGTFKSGKVIGSLAFPNAMVVPVRLVATNEKTLARIPEFTPFAELKEFIDMQNSLVPEEEAQQFARDNPASPLTRMALLGIVEGHCRRKSPSKDLEAAIEAALDAQDVWGARCRRQANFSILQTLDQSGYDAEFSLKFVDDLETLSKGDDSLSEVETNALKTIRQRIKLRQAFASLQSPDADVRKQGRQYARDVLAEMPYSVFVLLALADDLRKEGELDEAIRLYAEIKALPMLELNLRQTFSNESIKRITPSQRLVELWKRQKRTDDLEEYVASIYEEKLFSFMGDDKPVEARPDGKGNFVVLAEIFTSCNSPDGVASDLTVSALGKIYPESMFVTLRYHQHTNAPDALANESSEARCFNFYRLPGAPVFLMSGRASGRVQGLMEQSGELYTQASKAVAERLSEETELKIGLSASRQADTIQIQAQVEGADLSNTNLRLRLALTESGVEYTGINGIRKHDMVVRAMPGGELGVGVTDGALKFDGTVDLAVLKKDLSDYLANFEENQGQKFLSKPLNLEQLHIVAFVQDDLTREVLQATVVSVKTPAAE